MLVDVSETAKEAGIKFPVALSQRVYSEYVTPDPRSVPFGQSIAGRLWDVVWMLRCNLLRLRLVSAAARSCTACTSS